MRGTMRIMAIAALFAAIGVSDHLEELRPNRSPVPVQAGFANLISIARADTDTHGNTPRSGPSADQLAKSTLIVAGEYAAGKTFAVGDRGLILISDSAASEWTVGETPTHRLLTGVTSPDETHAWAVGHDAIILFSGDGGRTWTEQFSAPDEEAPLFGVWFDGPDRGIAFGAYGLIVETSDGGANWTQRSIDEEGPHHYGLCESPAGSLYVAGEFGSILRSGDKGQTWSKLPSPYAGTWFGALALEDGALLIFGLRGNLFRSEDQGETWAKIETGTHGSLLGGTQLKDGSVLLVGLNGVTLYSRDGRTFESSPRQDRLGHSTVVETPEKILLFGERGVTTWTR